MAPRVALGTVQWGLAYGVANRWGRPSDAEVRALLDVARGGPVDALDTAHAYGDAEEVVGRLVPAEAPWTLVTKVTPDLPEAAGAVPAAVDRSLEESFARLRRDHVDTVLFHRAAHLTAWGGAAWAQLRRWQDDGRVRTLGVSTNSPTEAWAALEHPGLGALQVAASLLDQRLLRRGFFAEAARRGVRVYVRSIFLQGLAHLSPAELPPGLGPVAPILTALDQEADRRGVGRTQLFVDHAAQLTCTALVLGCETAAQLRENLTSLRASEGAARDRDPEGVAARIPALDDDLLTPSEWAKLR